MPVFQTSLSVALAAHILRVKVNRNKHYPLVLMLEPTFRCNLKCAGCGKVREYRDFLDRTLDVDACLGAARECGAPVVSLTGGEPLVHPQIGEIVSGLIRDRRYVNLCTNGLLLADRFDLFTPDRHLSFVIHIDGFSETHDRIAERAGAYDGAVSAIREAKRRGFRVLTNTTVFRGSDPDEIAQLFQHLTKLGVDGIMMAAAFGYEDVVSEGAAGQFLTRDEAPVLFSHLREAAGKVPFYHTYSYLRFLSGEISLECSPWSTPTRNPVGWKSPCYLITDGHFDTYRELMEHTPWEKYGSGKDPRCEGCIMHSGYEGSAVEYMLHRRQPSPAGATR